MQPSVAGIRWGDTLTILVGVLIIGRGLWRARQLRLEARRETAELEARRAADEAKQAVGSAP